MIRGSNRPLVARCASAASMTAAAHSHGTSCHCSGLALACISGLVGSKRVHDCETRAKTSQAAWIRASMSETGSRTRSLTSVAIDRNVSCVSMVSAPEGYGGRRRRAGRRVRRRGRRGWRRRRRCGRGPRPARPARAGPARAGRGRVGGRSAGRRARRARRAGEGRRPAGSVGPLLFRDLAGSVVGLALDLEQRPRVWLNSSFFNRACKATTCLSTDAFPCASEHRPRGHRVMADRQSVVALSAYAETVPAPMAAVLRLSIVAVSVVATGVVGATGVVVIAAATGAGLGVGRGVGVGSSDGASGRRSRRPGRRLRGCRIVRSSEGSSCRRRVCGDRNTP
jgi:hypothetical protein